jgi:hypothetical protein
MTTIDGRLGGPAQRGSFSEPVSCPTPAFCIVVDDIGNVSSERGNSADGSTGTVSAQGGQGHGFPYLAAERAAAAVRPTWRAVKKARGRAEE